MLCKQAVAVQYKGKVVTFFLQNCCGYARDVRRTLPIGQITVTSLRQRNGTVTRPFPTSLMIISDWLSWSSRRRPDYQACARHILSLQWSDARKNWLHALRRAGQYSSVRQLNAGLARYIQRDNVYLAVDSGPTRSCPARPDLSSRPQAVRPSVRPFSRGLANVASTIVDVPVMSSDDNLTWSVDGDNARTHKHT